MDCSPPGFSVHGILQARTLEWVAISFSNAWKWKVKVKLLSHVWLLATPWTAAYQAPPSMGFSGQQYWSEVPLSSPPCYLDRYKKPQNSTRALRRYQKIHNLYAGSWWWTGRPGVLRFMGLQRVGHDWAADLIWSDQNKLAFPLSYEGRASSPTHIPHKRSVPSTLPHAEFLLRHKEPELQ